MKIITKQQYLFEPEEIEVVVIDYLKSINIPFDPEKEEIKIEYDMKFHEKTIHDLSHETIAKVSIKSKTPYNGFDITKSTDIILDEKLINSLLSKAYSNKIFIEGSYTIQSQWAVNHRHELYLEYIKEEEIDLLKEDNDGNT